MRDDSRFQVGWARTNNWVLDEKDWNKIPGELRKSWDFQNLWLDNNSWMYKERNVPKEMGKNPSFTAKWLKVNPYIFDDEDDDYEND